MKFGPLPLAQAEGKLLGHNVAAPDGRRALRKGKPLTAEDMAVLRSLGRTSVYVAELEPSDVGEDAAARRVAEAVLAGGESGLRLSGPASGRVNLLAQSLGVVRVNVPAVHALNAHLGITLATAIPHSVAQPRQIVGTIKIIPFAVPEASVQAIEALAQAAPLLHLTPLLPKKVSLIFSGAEVLHARLTQDFAPLRERVEALGSNIISTECVPLEDEPSEQALALALERCQQAGAQLIVLAGETAIMDVHDIAPRAIDRVGGQVAAFGVPVDPGNLLLLAYWGTLPILGAPGCARSRKANIVDWVLPRLLAGDALTQADLLTLGPGGLLEDAPERPMPRAN